ncbi:MAG: pitrilysin family protein [Salinivirgaceae bacterium]
MIKFEEITLDNGLRVVANYDPYTPMATLNLLYKVGAKHENPHQTGVAHLFEHLMFSGSANVPDFDAHVENAGGNNNAYTTPDYTNYYISLPAANIETAFWLESDRMAAPVITQEKLDIQKKVVIEEFKQRSLDPPYGDAMHFFLPLAYQKHPYRWPVIGEKIDHIESVTLADALQFHKRFYNAGNAVLTVSGNVKPEIVFQLAEKWFGDIQPPKIAPTIIPIEPEQHTARTKTVTADVPLDAIYMAWPMLGRDSQQFIHADLLTDLLSFDRSSRFYQLMNQENAVFAELDAMVSGTVDNGLMLITGKVNSEYSVDDGLKVIQTEIEKIQQTITEAEVLKVKNKAVTSNRVGRLEHGNKAPALAFAAMMGETNRINTVLDDYLKITVDDMLNVAKEVFDDSRCNTLLYKAKNLHT